MQKIYSRFVLFIMITLIGTGTSCRKFLDVGLPEDLELAGEVFQHDSLAQAAINGIYTKIGETFGFLHGQIGRYGALSCDELHRTIPNEVDSPFLRSKVDVGNQKILEMWSLAYGYLHQANLSIEGLQNSPIDPDLNKRLHGEARFLRALCYFHLVNAFGDVPLVLTTDYTVNDRMPRTPGTEIYSQMVEDLQLAQSLLPESYTYTPAYNSKRLRANRFTAMALLARMYLYTGKWAEAEAAATAVIQSGMYELEPDPAKVFSGNSREAIFQFMSINNKLHAADGSWYIPSGPNTKPAFVLTASLLAAFEPGDARLAWIRKVVIEGTTYYSPYKYRGNEGVPADEFNTPLRLGEQYLVRAEARARQNKIAEAVHDVNIIRLRARLNGLHDTINAFDLQAAIEHERRIELFCEWAHRWFDLKRWPARQPNTSGIKRIDEVMLAFKPVFWRSEAALWPIPGSEVLRNPNLKQNPGY